MSGILKQLGAKKGRKGKKKKPFSVFFSLLNTCKLAVYDPQVFKGYAPGILQK